MNYINDFVNKEELQVVFGDSKIRALRFYHECIREDEIGIIEAEVEESSKTLGVYQLTSIEIYNEKYEHIHDDIEIIGTQDFRCRLEIEDFLVDRYGISKDLVRIDGDI